MITFELVIKDEIGSKHYLDWSAARVPVKDDQLVLRDGSEESEHRVPHLVVVDEVCLDFDGSISVEVTIDSPKLAKRIYGYSEDAREKWLAGDRAVSELHRHTITAP